MKKKFIMAALSAAAVAGLACFSLTSCGGTTVEGANEEFEVLSLNVLKEEETTVEFWHSFGDAVSSVLEPLVESFEEEMAEQGYKIKVKIVNKGGGYDGLRKAVNMGVDSSAVPTLVLGYPDHFADYIKQDILLPLDDYINAEGEIGLTDTNDFVDSYWAENQMVIEGQTKTAGLPFNKSTEIMCYNASVVDPILKELGYVENVGDAWTNPTWEQVFAVGDYINTNKKTITWESDKGTQTIDYANMKYPVYVDSEANFFITTSRQWGGDGAYTTIDSDGKGTVTAKNASTKAAMEYFLNEALVNKTFEFPQAGGSGSYGSSYMQVRKAFISIGSTAGVKNNAVGNFEMKATTVPQKGYGETDTQAAIQQGTNLAILTKNSNNKTRLAAWMLMKYLTSAEQTMTLSMNTGYLPVRKSARKSDEFKALISDHDNIFTGAVAKGLTAALAEESYYFTDPAFNGSSIARDNVAEAVYDMFILGKSYDTAMNTYYKTLSTYRIQTK